MKRFGSMLAVVLLLGGCGTAPHPGAVAPGRATEGVAALGETSVKAKVKKLASRTLLAVTAAKRGLPDFSVADDVAIRAAVNLGFKRVWGVLGEDAESDAVREVLDGFGFKRYQIAFTGKQTEKTINALQALKDME